MKFEYKILWFDSHFLIQKSHCQIFHHIDEQHPKSLKISILYSQALWIKRIYTTPIDEVIIIINRGLSVVVTNQS